MDVIRHTIKYRLAKLIEEPGGLTEAEMLERADEVLHKAHDRTLAAFDKAMEKLHASAGPNAKLGELYYAAIGVAELAELAGFAPVGAAAVSLCDLLESGDDTPLVRSGVVLHLNAITLLRADTTISAAAKAKLQQGLHDLVSRARGEQAVSR